MSRDANKNTSAGHVFDAEAADIAVLRELADDFAIKYTDSISAAQLAAVIKRSAVTSYRGLSPQALRMLADIRAVRVDEDCDTREIVRRLKKADGFRGRVRKRLRRMAASALSGMLGQQISATEDELDAAAAKKSLKDDIERRGVAPAIADRLKGSADEYIAAKLDEIELRIDRKLDEIDSRLTQWRDREIENRLKIIRITLTASAAVALISVAYAWLKRHMGW